MVFKLYSGNYFVTEQLLTNTVTTTNKTLFQEDNIFGTYLL